MSAILGLECGATTSTAIVQFSDGSSSTYKFGPANYKLINKEQLHDFFLNIRETIVKSGGSFSISKIGIGMSGILTDADKQVVNKIVSELWPNLEYLWIGNDLETALASLDGSDSVKIIIISGTGSGCYGTNGLISTKVGGYGHILGDRGSGYSIAHQGLRGALREYELTNKSILLDSLIASLILETLDELVSKTLSPEFTKTQMAALAPLIFEAWSAGDSVATTIINSAMQDLAEDCVCLAKKLISPDTANIKIGLTGSIMTESLKFQGEFQQLLKEVLAKTIGLDVEVQILKGTYSGALKIITKNWNSEIDSSVSQNSASQKTLTLSENELRELILPIRTSLSPTECRNPKSKNLDKMSVPDTIDLWLEEESLFYQKISEHKPTLEKIIGRVTKGFQNGGRLFYVGAGTSGRLGILDASECPPTFKSPPHWVQGIISGGSRAIQNSVEGAEDSILGGMKGIQDREISLKDIVIGIASSGTTPFVWGALYKAKELGAFTCLLSFNPHLILKLEPDEKMLINIGPEILTGSTRLKCGSATKCILNMITTLSMVQYGKCLENLMVDLNPACQKLRERSLRIVLAIVNSAEGEYKKKVVSEDFAHQILVKYDYDIKQTVQELSGN